MLALAPTTTCNRDVRRSGGKAAAAARRKTLRIGIRFALATCVLALLTTPAAAQADSTAETGDATAVTPSSATLHGVINSSDPDSAWTFRYGLTSNYRSFSSVQSVGSGLTFVSTTIRELKPSTVYHYQLFVSEGSYPASYHPGDDRTFTTLAKSTLKTYGKASLKSRTFLVRKGAVQVRVSCKGSQGTLCQGRLRLSTRGRLRGKQRTLVCALGRLGTSAPHAVVLSAPLRHDCWAMLSAAPRHRLQATLSIRFSGPQHQIISSVTLTR